MKSVAELEEALTTPSPELVTIFRQLVGDIMVLGAGGKLGPSIVRLALRAARAAGDDRKVFAVSRFANKAVAESLADAGATIVTADIVTREDLERLPDADNVIHLINKRFGSDGNEAHTWSVNAYFSGMVAERFRKSRIVALSSGNVYPLSLITSRGPTEQDPIGPIGEYAMSCLGRERIMSAITRSNDTPLAIIRLNYASEMRYGVLVDIARALLAGRPIDVSMGYVNIVWQGYAVEVILRSLAHAATPPFLLNVTGPEIISVRKISAQLAAKMGVTCTIEGVEAPEALLSNAGRCHRLFGYPAKLLDQMIEDIAQWQLEKLPVYDRSTGFQRRDGRF